MSTAIILPEDYWIWTPGMPIDLKRFPKHVRDIIQQIQDHTRSYFFPFPGFGGFRRKVFITIGNNQTNLNLATFGGSLVSTAADYVYTNAGQLISATSTGAYACRTGSFPAGSTLKLINNGNIWGAGGVAGAGGSNGDVGASGAAGGPAMLLEFTLVLDNGGGNVFGGGGGGGGGGSGRHNCGVGQIANSGGGGGGGGRGSISASGGSGGSGNSSGVCVGGSGNSGGTGSSDGAGGGGSGFSGSAIGGNGGNGGDWGAAGNSGGSGAGNQISASGGGGGAGGAAIALNGFSINIIAGNNGSQIKGSVG